MGSIENAGAPPALHGDCSSLAAMQRFPVRGPGLIIGTILIVAACGGATDPGFAEGASSEKVTPLTTTTVVQLGPGPTTTLTPAPTVTTAIPAEPLTGLEATLVADGFQRPADARAPVGDERIFVVDQPGYVYIVADGETLEEPFLDISEEVSFDENERGLVTIAFHPRYHDNGRFYVFYTDLDFTAVLVEFRVSDDPDRADPDSARTILALPQERKQHQSGAVAFGPEGYLWLSLGDGGGIGDPDGLGQDPTNLYGTVVRLDVDAAQPYAIPPGNPYVDTGNGEPWEIWAYGVRNPWRISIDIDTGLLYVADVGQEGYEEIDVVPAASGGAFNFGWSTTEGTECYFVDEAKKEAAAAGALSCDKDGITMPAYQYDRSAGGCAIVGGSVYRGAAIPELHGTYFYGDYCKGALFSFRYVDDRVIEETEWLDTLGNITTIGTDGNGELLVTNLQGQVQRIDPVRNQP